MVATIQACTTTLVPDIPVSHHNQQDLPLSCCSFPVLPPPEKLRISVFSSRNATSSPVRALTFPPMTLSSPRFSVRRGRSVSFLA